MAVTFSVELHESYKPKWVDTSVIRRIKAYTINISVYRQVMICSMVRYLLTIQRNSCLSHQP